MKGWEYAKDHPDEAVKIILAGDSTARKLKRTRSG